MVYEWDDKEDECYRLYVEEKRALDEVMRVLREKYGFSPSKRAFQTQFKRWEFPAKQVPAYQDAALVERVRQLWEANTSQKDMVRVLNDEGFDIKERELMRVRAKHRWLLRASNASNASKAAAGGALMGGDATPDDGVDGPGGDGGADVSMGNVERTLLEEAGKGGHADLVQRAKAVETLEQLPPEVQEKRELRRARLQEESDARWTTKKRRRRTRGWAGLPADPPGPPRFPSETTIDESKAFLHLDNALYQQVRDDFQSICQQAGFIKKTAAGPERWQEAKQRLITENAHLNHQFYGPLDGVPAESKSLALDVICTDVTKRMRTLETRLTIPEAKNVLQVNPEEARRVRQQFYDILVADHFTSKIEAGGDHWKELKQQWIDGSELLQRLLAPGEGEGGEGADAQLAAKHRALEVLCRDVMKRLRDDQTKRDPSRKKQHNTGPGPGPAPPRVTPSSSIQPVSAPTTPTALPPPRPARQRAGQTDLQIDPSLLAAASQPSLLDKLQQYAAESQNLQPAATHTAHAAPAAADGEGSVPVYFRLSPASPRQAGPKLWLGTLAAATLAELRELVAAEHPGAALAKVEGVVPDDTSAAAAAGPETLFPIDRDDELAAYLQYVASGKPTFSVQLVDAA